MAWRAPSSAAAQRRDDRRLRAAQFGHRRRLAMLALAMCGVSSTTLGTRAAAGFSAGSPSDTSSPAARRDPTPRKGQRQAAIIHPPRRCWSAWRWASCCSSARANQVMDSGELRHHDHRWSLRSSNSSRPTPARAQRGPQWPQAGGCGCRAPACREAALRPPRKRVILPGRCGPCPTRSTWHALGPWW